MAPEALEHKIYFCNSTDQTKIARPLQAVEGTVREVYYGMRTTRNGQFKGLHLRINYTNGSDLLSYTDERMIEAMLKAFNIKQESQFLDQNVTLYLSAFMNRAVGLTTKNDA